MNPATARSTAFGVVAGATVGMFAARAPELLILAVVAAFGLLLGRRPALTLGLFLLIDQTYTGTSYYQDVGAFVTTGHQLYEPVKNFPPALLLLALALGLQLYSGRGVTEKRLHAHGLDGIGLVLVALIFWSVMLSLSQEKLDFSGASMLRIATNALAAALPWLLMLLAYAVAVPMLRQPGGRADFTKVVAGALIVKALLGIASLLTTRGAVIDGQANVVYYDAALPMVAGMAMIGFLLASHRDVPWRKVILFLAGTIVVFSFRRSVWSAMVLAVVLLPMVRMHTVVVRRLATAVLVSLLVFLVLPASTKVAAFSRVGSGVKVALGNGTEESAQHHKRDVERGYEIAQENVWVGVGLRSPQRREFAYQAIDRIYVHNDPLQVWLRLGLPGVLLYLILLAVLLRRGIATLRRRGPLSVLDAGAATFAVVLLLAVAPAPFVSETIRWPIFVGVVAAILRTSSTDARAAAVQVRLTAAAAAAKDLTVRRTSKRPTAAV